MSGLPHSRTRELGSEAAYLQAHNCCSWVYGWGYKAHTRKPVNTR